MLTLEAAKAAFSAAGTRITPQRLMVVEALVGNRTHPTADAIYARVRAQYPSLSLATVYHTLALLARQGLVLELHAGKDGLRCDPDTTPHAHAYCEECGAVSDLPLVEDFTVPTSGGFTMKRAEVSVYGLCPACQAVPAEPASGLL